MKYRIVQRWADHEVHYMGKYIVQVRIFGLWLNHWANTRFDTLGAARAWIDNNKETRAFKPRVIEEIE